MPSFSFTPVVKKGVENKPKTSNNIRVDVRGIVVIDLNGIYTVKVDNDNYPISSKNFSCKGKMVVYSQTLTKLSGRLVYIRTEDNAVELPKNAYLPFCVGALVSGNIIVGNIFDIKKVAIDNKNPDAIEAMRFYRNNYEIIQENRLKHYYEQINTSK